MGAAAEMVGVDRPRGAMRAPGLGPGAAAPETPGAAMSRDESRAPGQDPGAAVPETPGAAMSRGDPQEKRTATEAIAVTRADVPAANAVNTELGVALLGPRSESLVFDVASVLVAWTW